MDHQIISFDSNFLEYLKRNKIIDKKNEYNLTSTEKKKISLNN